MTEPEWEMSKENVAPMRTGRDVQILNKALTTSKHQLEAQRVVRERQLRDSIAGLGPHKDDPIEAWSLYVKWLVESFPAASDTLVRAVEEACRTYAKTERYRDDIRLLRLWIRYIDLRTDKLDVFNYMIRKRIGESWSLFYEAWAVTLEVTRQYDQAERAYKIGRENNAKPMQRLLQREREYFNRMAARKRRDEQKKKDSEKKKQSDSRKDTARKERQSSRTGSSLANSILSQPDRTDTSSGKGAPMHRVRPALGRISEEQASSGRRPFVLERRERQGATPTSSMRGSGPAMHEKDSGKFEIYSDTRGPSLNRGTRDSIPIHADGDDFPAPALPKRDEVRKENEGRLPTKWAGETLPQSAALKEKVHRNTSASFEVYQDPGIESLEEDPYIRAAIKDVRGQATGSRRNEPDIEAKHGSSSRASSPLKRKSSTATLTNGETEGPPSPTINTKLAMKEVDDMFSSSLPMERDSELLERRPTVQTEASTAPGNRDSFEGHRFEIFDEKENALGRRPRPENQGGPAGNPALEKRVLQPIPEMEGPYIRRVDDDDEDAEAERTVDRTEEDHNLLVQEDPSMEPRNLSENDLTGFLATWCNNDSHFQLLDDPDPEVAPDDMFDMQCRQGLVSFNIDKYMWKGHRHHSQVFLADDLNNAFGLMQKGTGPGSDDEDDFKVVALKVSKDSNAWEYYMYKTIHSRMQSPSRTIPHAIAFCEGNPKSYLILDSYSHCSVQQGLALSQKFSESLCMFFTVGILQALEEVHSTHAIHSDVTLDNILIRSDLTVDISRHPFSTNADGPWSSWGLYLVDFNHAIDAALPHIRCPEITALANYAGSHGNAFMHEDYRVPNAQTWAYNADCYAASVCSAKMLGIAIPDLKPAVKNLQHAGVWEKFFSTMQGMDCLSSAKETGEAMRALRVEMEQILQGDKLLAISLMRLTNDIIDAENADMTQGF